MEIPTLQKEGKIKFFNVTKGYGFIIIPETNSEYFFHFSALGGPKDIPMDTIVTFDVEEGKKGLQAINIKRK